MSGGARCGYTVTDRDGIEEPCDRPATGWRWYQDCGHEDTLDAACDLHANEGGRRLAEAERQRDDALAKIARVEAVLAGRSTPATGPANRDPSG